MKQNMLSFILAVLNDDHGIDEVAWGHLWNLYQETENETLYKILQKVEAVDGRYFITEENIGELG